jgi:hypothetical protein
MMISEWTLWSHHEFRLHDVCVASPVLGSPVLALLLCLGKDVMIHTVSLLDLSEDVVIRLVLLLDLGEDGENLSKDMVGRQDLVGLVSTYYHLLARNVSWTGLAFRRRFPSLDPCLSHHHHRHHHRPVCRSRSSLLVVSI